MYVAVIVKKDGSPSSRYEEVQGGYRSWSAWTGSTQDEAAIPALSACEQFNRGGGKYCVVVGRLEAMVEAAYDKKPLPPALLTSSSPRDF